MTVTTTQRELHNRYQEIHQRFFPKPKLKSAPKVAESVINPEPKIPPPMPARPPVPISQTGQRLSIIKRTVCEAFEISRMDLESHVHRPSYVLPRHLAMYLARKYTLASFPMIGRNLGARDHTTVLNGVRKTGQRLIADGKFAVKAARVEADLKIRFGETPRKPRDCIARYVPHERVEDHFKVGWMWAANLNEYAALMIWPCGCECVAITPPAHRPKENHKSHNNIITSKQGTSLAYTLSRLKRERPDLFEKVAGKEMSANAAALEAGFRKKPLKRCPECGHEWR